jgi:hypothetical protein
MMLLKFDIFCDFLKFMLNGKNITLGIEKSLFLRVFTYFGFKIIHLYCNLTSTETPFVTDKFAYFSSKTGRYLANLILSSAF